MCFYLIVKGVEILQIALASSRPVRGGIIGLGVLTLIACVVAAAVFGYMQVGQAESIQQHVPSFPSQP